MQTVEKLLRRYAPARVRRPRRKANPMTDEQAIAAITRTLTHNTGADPAWTAHAIITRLRSLGWRPTNAQPPPDWKHRDQPPAPPTAGYLAARPRSTP